MNLKQALIALDQAINCWFFWWLPGGTWADETLSARAFRCQHIPPFTWLRPLIDTLFWWDPLHCFSSWMSEKFRMHCPPEER